MEKFQKFPKIAHAKTLKKSTCYINESENKQKPELKYDPMTKADSWNPNYNLANPNYKLQSFNHLKLNLLAYYPMDYQNAFHFL